MPSAPTQSAADATVQRASRAPLQDKRIDTVGKDKESLEGLDAAVGILNAARGTVPTKRFLRIQAAACKMAKQLKGCGVSGPRLDTVVVTFLGWSFQRGRIQKENAWDEYMEVDLNHRSHCIR